MKMYCGAAKSCINPPLGTLLSGYMSNRPSQGIHDPLYARVLVLENDFTKAAIISLDLVGVDRFYISRLREKVERSFQIPQKQVLVHATHTHSGPGGTIHESSPVWKAFANIWMPYNHDLVEQQHERILEAVGEALASLEPCTVSYGSGIAHGIAANRISSDREYHPEVQVAVFSKSNGKNILLYHFACHPTVMHADNLWVSADFPGAANLKLEQHSEVEMAVFLNGPSGDVSTRFTRRSSSFSEVERFGYLLADAIGNILRNTQPLPPGGLEVWHSEICLPIRTLSDEEELTGKLSAVSEEFHWLKTAGLSPAETRKWESKIEGLTGSLQLAKSLQGISFVETEIHVIAVGDIHFASVPGEMFFETGREIMASVPNRKLFLLGNTNDYIGYIVPQHYYKEENYESSMTLLQMGSSETLRNLIITRLGGNTYVSS